MKQYTLLTNSGINKLLKTASDGSKIALKEIVVSDYDGELSEQTTSILNEKYRGAINAITIDESDSNILDVDAIIPPEVGGFYIKTAGIYCDDGSLFAVARLADTYKPLLNEGSSKDITLNFKLQIANASESVILKVDNNVVLATRKWSDATFLKKTDKIDAYTKRESDDKFALKYAVMLPNGDYTKVGFWRNLEAGKYFASIPALRSQGQIPKNYPSEYGFIELIVVGGERYVLWRTFNLASVALRFNQIPSDDVNLEWAPINGERFLNVGRVLLRGDANLSSYWNNLKSGTYFYNEGINMVSNMPNGTRTAHIEYRNVEGEIAVICYASDAKIYIRSGTPTVMRPWMEITTPSLGVNQTLQDVKSQRRVGEIYTNNTGKPIFITVICESSSQGGTYETWLEIGGVVVQKVYGGATSGLSPKASVCGVIPAGATYKITTYNNKGSTVIAGWTELR